VERAARVKPEKQPEKINAGRSDQQFIHRKPHNPQGSGRSSDLLRLFSTPSRRFWDRQWHNVETSQELTAAGTVAESHGIPYYPFPEPLQGKSRDYTPTTVKKTSTFFLKNA